MTNRDAEAPPPHAFFRKPTSDFAILRAAFRRTGQLIALAGLLGAARGARADVASCVESHASGQRATKEGHLTEASKLFASCGASGEACPNEIRAECVALYTEVQRNIPTVTFSAVDARGADVVDVRVYSDDALLCQRLDGRALAIDPGMHRFRFEFAAGGVVSTNVLIREGEKNRILTARAPKTAAAMPEAAGSAAEQSRGDRALPAGFWLTAGVGVAALGSFATFALLGHGEKDKIEACSPSCPASRHDTFTALRRDYLLADLSLGVAVASAGVATWLLLSPRSPNSANDERGAKRPAHGLALMPLLSAHGAGLWLTTDAL
jgi:hypothetical protein